MSAAWTANGQADIANVKIGLVATGVDTCDFVVPGRFDAGASFGYGDRVTVTGPFSFRFVGTCITVPRYGSGNEEGVSYRLVGPWWHLERCVYQQAWKVKLGADPEWKLKSRVILNQDEDGAKLSTGAQIAAVAAYAVSKGAPFAVGAVEPDIQVPVSEERDLTCSEVIIRMLRFSPDAVCWFDYSGPTPVMHCRRVANLTERLYSCSGRSPVSSFRVSPRSDLRVPGISLKYETRFVDDNTVYESMHEDNAGDHAALGAIVSTIQLAEGGNQYVSQEIETGEFPYSLLGADPNTAPAARAFVKLNVPALSNVADGNWSIVSATRSGELHLDNYLTDGTISDWMKDNLGVRFEEETFEVKLNINTVDKFGTTVKTERNRVFPIRKKMTDARSGVYRWMQSGVAAEPVPTGLAASLFASWNRLAFEGELTLCQQEVSGIPTPGNRVRLAGVPGCEGMSELVQGVTIDVDVGSTTIQFGPPTRLGPADLLAFTRSMRQRKSCSAYMMRRTGKSADDTKAVVNSGSGPLNDSSTGTSETGKEVIQTEDADQLIDLDPDSVDAEGKVIQVSSVDGKLVAQIQHPRLYTPA